MHRIKKLLAGVAVAGLVPVTAIAAFGDESDAAATCPEFGQVDKTGVTSGQMGLREASGLIASARNPGVFWTHNDNSGQNRVFALDAGGNVLASFWLDGTATGSIEDIGFGTGPDGADWIHLGDFGDNKDARPQVAIHRFPEPQVDLAWRSERKSVAADQVETVRVRYREPGTDRTWARDAEAFAIDPETGDLFVFEKKLMHVAGVTQAAYVYRIPADDLQPGPIRIAEPISLVRSRTVATGAGLTAADISRDGSMIVAKNMTEVFVWPRQPGQTVAEVLEAHPEAPCRAPAEIGEAIAVAPDGSALIMVREGVRTPLWWVPVTKGVEIVDVVDSEEPKPPRVTEPPAEPVTPTTTTSTVPVTTSTTTVPVTTTTEISVGGAGVPPVTTTTEAPTPEPRTTELPPADPVVIDDPVVAAPMCGDLVATIVGTDGDDVIRGTKGDDVIVAGPGNDVVYGYSGNDTICGEAGDDELRGSAGNDVIYGGSGNDVIFGGSGDDLLRGHGGDDKLYGGTGSDVLAGNRGSDVLVGSVGDDRLAPKGNDDRCYVDTRRDGLTNCADLP